MFFEFMSALIQYSLYRMTGKISIQQKKNKHEITNLILEELQRLEKMDYDIGNISF